MMPNPILSVVIPSFNEAAAVAATIERIRAIPVRKEIIVVDDGSDDGTRQTLVHLYEHGAIDQLVLHDGNHGKATAVRSGIRCAWGEIIALQNADVEYDPHELSRLMQPILEGRADVVFGSRSLSLPQRVAPSWQRVRSRMPTLVSNLLATGNLDGAETGCRLVRADLLQSLPLCSERFGFESELTARLAWAGARIHEIPFCYSERVPSEAQKSNWKDWIMALWDTLRWNLLTPPAPHIPPLALQPSARRAELFLAPARLAA